MRKIAITLLSCLGGVVGYFFVDERIAAEVWRQVDLAWLVSVSSLLIGVCFYVGLILTPAYTKRLAEADSRKAMRQVDATFADMAWFYLYALLFFFAWHIGLNAFIDQLLAWNAFLGCCITFLFVNWLFAIVDMAYNAFEIVRTIAVTENAKGSK